MKKLLFLFALSLCSLAAWAYDFSAVAPTGQTLYYTITSDSTVEVTGGTSLTGSLTIPNTVVNGSDTYSVTSIKSYAFSECSSLTSVDIPNSVTRIGISAFNSCSSLTCINIPNGVTSINEYVFSSCSSLSSMTIPNSVTSIGIGAFFKCRSLTSVTIGSGVTSIQKKAFMACNHLVSIVCNAIIPPTVADTNAFSGVWKSLPLIVPIESAGQYQSAYGWRDFYNIIGAPLGIEDVDREYKVLASNGAIAVSGAEGQTLRIYDVQGRLVVSDKAADNKLHPVPTTGVYLVQVGKHRAQKVVVGR